MHCFKGFTNLLLVWEILIDDVPLEEYDLQYLRQRIVIVDQATVLFNDTIRSNIAYGTDATDEEVIEALKAAKAWEFVNEMPDKIWSEVSEGGDNLSGGQRQRLAIARAMVRKPDVILLDEATSALDNKSEAMVQEALDQLSKQGSSLVIAHRLSTIKDSDKIVVIDNGQKVEEGTHSELMAGELGTEDCRNYIRKAVEFGDGIKGGDDFGAIERRDHQNEEADCKL